MPIFNVKVKHGAHEGSIPVRADSPEAAKTHVQGLHGYDYLQHFKTLGYEDKKHHANKMTSPFSTAVETGAPLGEKSIVSVEQAHEDCPTCGAKRAAQ